MAQTVMYDECSGSITEAYLHLTPTSMGFVSEAVDFLNPDARIYIACPPTLENLRKRLDNFSEAHKSDIIGEHAVIFAEMIRQCPSMANLFVWPDYSTQALAKAVAGDNAGFALDMWKFYSENNVFRAFVRDYLMHMTAKTTKYTDKFMRSLKEKAPERVFLIESDEQVSGWPRDRVIAGVDYSGQKALIQGKMEPRNRDLINMGPAMERNDVSLVLNDFWPERGFSVVPNTEIGLSLYENGDIRTTAETAFIGPETYSVNAKLMGKAGVVTALRDLTGKRRMVFLHGKRPRIHTDLYLTPLEENEVAVGDVEPCRKVMKGMGIWNNDYDLPSRTRGKELDAIAAYLKGEGFEVERIPLFYTENMIKGERVPSHHTTRSYANGIINGRDFNVAHFGVPELDEMSAEVFEKRNWNVKAVKSMGTLMEILDESNRMVRAYGRAGVRCSLNVLSMSSKPVKYGTVQKIENLVMGDDEPDMFSRLTSSIAKSNEVGRNMPCPCKSGKKFKRCCGKC